MQASLLPQRTFTQDTSELTPRYTTRGTPPPPQRREQQARRSRPTPPPARPTTPPDSATSSSNSASLPPPTASKSPPVHQPGDRAFTLQRESPITATSTSDNETPVPRNRVCWHYMRGDRAHSDNCACLLCAGFDLDAICWHYVSGECTHDDQCARFHPAELDPVLIPLLVTPPYQKPPPMAGQGQWRETLWNASLKL